MKRIIGSLCVFIGFLLTGGVLNAQTPTRQVEAFFEAFHQRDTSRLRSFFHDKARLSSYSKRADQLVIQEETVNDFLHAIASIPEQTRFEERLLSFETVDAQGLIQVFTPYEFYVNGTFSHCGTNIFSMVLDQEGYRIVALADTRNRSCD